MQASLLLRWEGWAALESQERSTFQRYKILLHSCVVPVKRSVFLKLLLIPTVSSLTAAARSCTGPAMSTRCKHAVNTSITHWGRKLYSSNLDSLIYRSKTWKSTSSMLNLYLKLVATVVAVAMSHSRWSVLVLRVHQRNPLESLLNLQDLMRQQQWKEKILIVYSRKKILLQLRRLLHRSMKTMSSSRGMRLTTPRICTRYKVHLLYSLGRAASKR